MEAYRDQYASVFNGGDGVTLMGISPDAIEELHSWASDADFPFLFAQDDGSTVEAYGGAVRDNGMTLERAVVVIDTEGRIHEWMTPFREIDPTAYEELRASIEAAGADMDDADVQALVEGIEAMSSECDR